MNKTILALAALWLAGSALAQDASAPTATLESGMQRVDYHCPGGKTLSVDYPDAAMADVVPIRVTWHGKRYRLVPVASASGARYASRQLEWWSKGDAGTLARYRGKTLAADCQRSAG